MRIGIRPTVDVVFKRIFATPAQAHITKAFLNSLLPLAKVPLIEEIRILNPFRLAEFAGDKEISVDVLARDKEGRDFQIEMQVRRDGALTSRILDNWARLYDAQIRKGEDYRLHSPSSRRVVPQRPDGTSTMNRSDSRMIVSASSPFRIVGGYPVPEEPYGPPKFL